MLQTHLQQWDASKIKQCENYTGEALLSDEQTLSSFSQDFGKLIHSPPSVVSLPHTIDYLQALIIFASQHQLPVTIRGNGLSQSGQSLAIPGGLTLGMQHLNKVLELEGESIWVEANASWASLLEQSLKNNLAPFVLPYNCNLSVAGVLSAGGVGASSFKYGSINAHVEALEVVDGLGEKHILHNDSALFHACLSGQGRFAVITKAQIQLRTVKPQAKTFCLVYADQQQWFKDIEALKTKADYLEMFCSPSVQGAKLKGEKRIPMAQWLYGLHVTVEFSDKAPELNDLNNQLKPMNIINTQIETIESYLLRHNSRFEVMRMLGQWDLFHPWYECFVPTKGLKENLSEILQDLPVHYANLVHIALVTRQKANFLMFPENEDVCSFMILNPGVPAALKDSCLQAIVGLDANFAAMGGKRYLSGYLGSDITSEYWANHFEAQFSSWRELKKQYDPVGIFTSILHPN